MLVIGGKINLLDLLMLSALVYIASKSGKKKRKKQFRLFKPVRIKKSKYDTWAYNPYNEKRKPRNYKGM